MPVTFTNTGIMAPPGVGCPAATNFINRSGISGTDATNYTNLICGLVTDGIISFFDALYIFAAPTSTVALLNLVSSSFNCTVSGTPTFTPYSGYIAITDSDQITNGFNPSTGSPQFTSSSGHLSLWNLSNNLCYGCHIWKLCIRNCRREPYFY